MSNKMTIKKYDIDLTKIAAPCIYLEEKIVGPCGDKVYKYRLQLKQPNKEFYTQDEIRALGCFLEEILNKYLKDLISINTKASFTGFSLCVLNNSVIKSIADALKKSLQEIEELKNVEKNKEKKLAIAKKCVSELLASDNNWLEVC